VVLFFCDNVVTISQTRSFFVKVRSLIIAITVQHILGATLLLIHFGTINLYNIPDIGILRMELEIGVLLTFICLFLDTQQGGYGIDHRRDVFVFFVFQATILSLISSFLVHNFMCLFLVTASLIVFMCILHLWKKEEVQIAQVIE